MNTIKKTILAVALVVSGFLIGCGSDVVASIGFNMDYIASDLVNWSGSFYLYEDQETRVEYIVYTNSDNIAITPRLKSDGSLYLSE